MIMKTKSKNLSQNLEVLIGEEIFYSWFMPNSKEISTKVIKGCCL